MASGRQEGIYQQYGCIVQSAQPNAYWWIHWPFLVDMINIAVNNILIIKTFLTIKISLQ